MRIKYLKYLLVIIPIISVLACEPEKDDYTEGWIGQWQTTDDIHYPQAKYLRTGTIIKDNSTRNQVILSGSLIDKNPSYQIPIKLSSENRGTLDYTSGFNMKGSAIFNSKDTIWLRLEITLDHQTERDTLILVKQ